MYLALPGLICHLLSILKMCPSAFRVSSPPGPGGEGAGIKPGPKLSLDRWGCVCKISTRSVRGFGFPFALHVPTDEQANICTPIFIKVKDYWCSQGLYPNLKSKSILSEILQALYKGDQYIKYAFQNYAH